MSTADALEVLVVEGYLGGSHAAWVDGLVAHSRHSVRVVSHPAAFWRWRLRGGALTLAEQAEAVVEAHGRPDVVLATDMVHLPAFLGFGRRFLGDPAVLLYLHESQLLYPDPPPPGRSAPARPAERREEAALVNWLSMAVADRILVNSASHRDRLFAELPHLLGRVPDAGHGERLEGVEDRTEVLPVGVRLDDLLDAARTPDDGGPPVVLWNQRWDHDKQPRRFFAALHWLEQEGVPFRLALAGHNERVDPREFTHAIEHFGGRLVAVRPATRTEYVELLLCSDVVVSTAAQETFGVAVVEAMAAGCVPVLPDRLSYPELVGREHAPATLYTADGLRSRLAAVLADLAGARRRVAGLREEMGRFRWERLAPRYDEVLASAARSRRSGA